VTTAEGLLTMPPAIAAATTSLAFAALWWRQTRTRDATSVDAAWAMAIGLLGIAAALDGSGSPAQRWLAGGIAAAWSLRLTLHLVRNRVMAGHGEDGRYRAMRAHWGARSDRGFFGFYQLQAAAALVFALPFWFLAGHAGEVLPVQWAGITMLAGAQFAEAVADRQLLTHRNDPSQRGRTCRRGLWRYSRHPNYFFEWLSWCAIGLVAWPAAGAWALVQPIVMFVLVRFVSGVPFAERQALKSRGDDYRSYRQETSVFVPLPPRRPAGGAR
jgi:steroid 5-alpha reductase family enzyme